MTIKEVEQRTGLPRSVVRFYEKEGLIAPRRGGENGYRDYQEEDVTLLTRIAFLRSLDVPIEAIARVLGGQASLADVAVAQADALPLGGPAPYPPVASAFGADGMSYDDGTISITIEKDVVDVTNVYFAYVTLTDVSQLRTALAAPFGQKKTNKI